MCVCVCVCVYVYFQEFEKPVDKRYPSPTSFTFPKLEKLLMI